MDDRTTGVGTANEDQAATGIKRVIFASSVGTLFEWYDFYLYGSLAAFFGVLFFPKGHETAAFLASLATFGAGFAVRPFGAILFGRIGDLVGRKYTFLITIIIMGLATTLIGFLPTYESIGILAPIILVTLRLAQGLALGGEYGGAATYVAEHAPQGRRGLYTSWIQTTATIGFFISLAVILSTRLSLGEREFKEYGWRIPFLASFVLLGVSVYIRLRLKESPLFVLLKAKGKISKSPAEREFWQSGEFEICSACTLWCNSRAGCRVVLRTVLRAVLSPEHAEDRFCDLVHTRRHCACYQYPAVPCGRVLVGSDRTQEDHDDGLPSCSADVLPHLQRTHTLRQSRTRSRDGNQSHRAEVRCQWTARNRHDNRGGA